MRINRRNKDVKNTLGRFQFPRVCRPAAAARSSRRRRHARFPVHLCIFLQLFGGAGRRQKSRGSQFVLRRIRFLLSTRPCLAELLLE